MTPTKLNDQGSVWISLRMPKADLKLIDDIAEIIGSRGNRSAAIRYAIFGFHIILKSEAWKNLPPLSVLAEQAVKLKASSKLREGESDSK